MNGLWGIVVNRVPAHAFLHRVNTRRDAESHRDVSGVRRQVWKMLYQLRDVAATYNILVIVPLMGAGHSDGQDSEQGRRLFASLNVTKGKRLHRISLLIHIAVVNTRLRDEERKR